MPKIDRIMNMIDDFRISLRVEFIQYLFNSNRRLLRSGLLGPNFNSKVWRGFIRDFWPPPTSSLFKDLKRGSKCPLKASFLSENSSALGNLPTDPSRLLILSTDPLPSNLEVLFVLITIFLGSESFFFSVEYFLLSSMVNFFISKLSLRGSFLFIVVWKSVFLFRAPKELTEKIDLLFKNGISPGLLLNFGEILPA